MLLAVALLCVGQNAWGETYLPTVTGTLESGNFQNNRNKVVTIAKGESLTYTFVNTSVGAAVYNNWVVEARDATTNYCCNLRGDAHPGGVHSGVDCGAGYWTWDNSTGTLSGSYSGSKWSDIDGTAASWHSAYSGVTVTLTIEYSSDGTTLTMTHSATVNSSPYTGTYTVTGFARNNINVFLSNEYAIQTITNVVKTDASGVVTVYERKNVDLSQFSGYYSNGSYSDGVATFSCSSTPSGTDRWCTLDLSDYYNGIPGQITDVNLTLTENITYGWSGSANTGTNRFGIGIYGAEKSFTTPNNVDASGAVTWWGIGGNNNNRYYSGGSNTNISWLVSNADAKIDILMNLDTKKFSFCQNNVTKVTNVDFNANSVTKPTYLAAESWSSPVQAAISNMSLEFVYSPNTAVIGSYGYATFSSTYPVNVDVTGLEAYIATGISGGDITMEKVTGNVAANTGLVLKGAANTYSLPVVASGTTYNQSSDPKNYLFALDGTFANVNVASTGKNYVMVVQNEEVVWAPVTDGEHLAPAPAGHAALWLDGGGARSMGMSFVGDITAVENVDAAPAEAKAKDGKFIENGKLVIVKNGAKYNAAGAKLY